MLQWGLRGAIADAVRCVSRSVALWVKIYTGRAPNNDKGEMGALTPAAFTPQTHVHTQAVTAALVTLV